MSVYINSSMDLVIDFSDGTSGMSVFYGTPVTCVTVPSSMIKSEVCLCSTRCDSDHYYLDIATSNDATVVVKGNVNLVMLSKVIDTTVAACRYYFHNTLIRLTGEDDNLPTMLFKKLIVHDPFDFMLSDSAVVNGSLEAVLMSGTTGQVVYFDTTVPHAINLFIEQEAISA